MKSFKFYDSLIISSYFFSARLSGIWQGSLFFKSEEKTVRNRKEDGMSQRKSLAGRSGRNWGDASPSNSLVSRIYHMKGGKFYEPLCDDDNESLSFVDLVVILKRELPRDMLFEQRANRIYASTRQLFPDKTRDDIMGYLP